MSVNTYKAMRTTDAGSSSKKSSSSKSSSKSNSNNKSSSSKLNTNTSIVDYLKAQGKNSSYSARKDLAKDYGISNYSGTAAQNIALLGKLKNGESPKQTVKNPSTQQPKAQPKKQTNTKQSSKKVQEKTDDGTVITRPSEIDSPQSYAPYVPGGIYGNASNASIDAMLSAQDQLKLLYAAVPALQNDYKRPDYVDVIDPTMKSAKELADLYGLTYDKDAIASIFNSAVEKEYDTRYAQQGISENNYYDQMASLQNTALDSIRQQQSQAIQTGANKGMQAANQLSAILGISQQAGENATQLAQSRGLLAKEHGAAQAKAAQDAMSYYDQMGLSLGEIAKQLYSYDVQQQAAQLGYNQGINTDYAGVMAQYLAAQSAIGQALGQGASSILGTYTSTLGNLESSRLQAAAQEAVARMNAEATKYAAAQQAAAAAQQAAATKYAADQNSKYYTQQQQQQKQVTGLKSTDDYLKSIGKGISQGASKIGNSLGNIYNNISGIFKK